MTSTLRAVAETRFAALTRREDTVLTTLEDEQRAVREKTARLKALRLSTEASIIADRTAQLKLRRRAKAST